MSRNEGTLAVKLDFGGMTTTISGGTVSRRSILRLASGSASARGPHKYAVLEHKRRQAQIRARRLLDLVED
jgi:hypothetical protein